MKLELRGEPTQEAFGRQLADLLRPPLILYLEGDLGTGKTTLTRGILRGLGHKGTVRSPTFTLLEPYDLGRWRLFHLDLYRLADPEELDYLGLRDLLDPDSVLIVEWPQRGGSALPPPDLEIRLAYQADARILECLPHSPAGMALVAALTRHRAGGSVGSVGASSEASRH